MKINQSTSKFISAALLAASVAHVGATQLSHFQTFADTDYTSAGVGGIREVGDASITLGGVTGSVTKAYLYWHAHGSASELSGSTTASVYVNDTKVSGESVGLSGANGWGFGEYDFSFGRAFRADVTTLVSGNGVYALRDFDPLGIAVQGASLIVIFNDGIPENNRDILVFQGCDENSFNTYDAMGWNVSIPAVPYAQGDAASIEFHVSDGQNLYGETALLLNQQQLAPAGNTFGGSAPYNPTNGFRYDFFTGSLWDIKNFDIAPLLTPGANNLSITAGFFDDKLSVILAVVALKAGGGIPPVIVNPNEPTIACPAPISLTAPAEGLNTVVTVAVADADGDSLTVTWTVNGIQVQQNAIPGSYGSTTVSLPLHVGIGSHSLLVTVSDSKGGIKTCNSSINVAPNFEPGPVPNRAPTAVNDSAATTWDFAVQINSLANDYDIDGDAVAIQTFTQPFQGYVTLGADGFFTFTPLPTFIGTASFQYTITDGSLISTATVQITVSGAPANLPPVAVADAASTVSGASTTIHVLNNDSDPELGPLSITGFTQPADGAVVLNADGSFTYTAPLGFVGQTTFQYTISDGVRTASTTVTVAVGDPTLPPPPPPTDGCELYPIALHIDNVRNVAPGSVITDVYNGVQPGNFGWLTWAGNPNVPTLATSLTPPGDSHTYVNRDNTSDHVISIGDWVEGSPGVSNSDSVRDMLDVLKTQDITIPVWDAVRRNGNNSDYRVINFARVRILTYRLPNENRITVTFLGFVQCHGEGGPTAVTSSISEPIAPLKKLKK